MNDTGQVLIHHDNDIVRPASPIKIRTQDSDREHPDLSGDSDIDDPVIVDRTSEDVELKKQKKTKFVVVVFLGGEGGRELGLLGFFMCITHTHTPR